MSLHDIQAERAVLGLVLQGLPVHDVAELRAEDFSDFGHPQVWASMLSLAAEGRPVDHITLAERLRARGRLAEVGVGAKDEEDKQLSPPAYLMTLDMLPAVAAHAPAYVKRLRECAQRREVAMAGLCIRDMAHDPNMPPARAAMEGVQLLSGIKSSRPLRMGGKDVLAQQERWDKAIRGEVRPYLPLPHEAFEGVFPGFVYNLNVVAGRSGGFKTGLLADCIWHWTKNLGLKGGVFGLEDGTGWAFDRLTARQLSMAYGDVGYASLGEGKAGEYRQEMYADWCAEAWNILNERLFVYDTSDTDAEALASDTPIADWPDVLQEMKRWIAEGARFVVIDHGLRIRYTADAKARYDMAIGRAMDTLANLGARHDCAIIVLWHLNRANEEGTAPVMADLKESGYLDAAMRSCLVNWESPELLPGQVLSTVVKHTRAEKGVTVALPKEQGGRFGLLQRTGGGRVDIAAEKRAQAEAKRSKGKGLFGKIEAA